ncbi:hypothetical protein ARMGADRAFT_1075185 [Armillaria gallica]|uniref:Uncharacterized protein n=1 Tax=Armillaria gallica TaxID=47427 RepID=A0A2H3DSX2_ARMGA|nr:hypothetical protein ARMGADRAFT_1075185 [Armillaria gallica]
MNARVASPALVCYKWLQVCSSRGEQSFADERHQGEIVCLQCHRSPRRHLIVLVSAPSFSASLPGLRSGGWNVWLDSRAGISTPQGIHCYSAIHFESASYGTYNQAVPSFLPVYFCMHIGRFRARVAAAAFPVQLVFHRVHIPEDLSEVGFNMEMGWWITFVSTFPGRNSVVSAPIYGIRCALTQLGHFGLAPLAETATPNFSMDTEAREGRAWPGTWKGVTFSHCEGHRQGSESSASPPSRVFRTTPGFFVERRNPSAMDDSKESLFVDNVIGAKFGAIPSCPSLHLPSLVFGGDWNEQLDSPKQECHFKALLGFNTGDWACLDHQEEAHSFLLDFASSREKCTFPPSSAVFVAPTWTARFWLALLAESAAPNAITDVCKTIPFSIRQRTAGPKAIIHLVKCDHPPG